MSWHQFEFMSMAKVSECSWCHCRLEVTACALCAAASNMPFCTFAGDRLAKIMDGKRTLLHANHGIIVCTETVAEAFDYLYYLEKAGEITVKAMSTGRPLQLIPKHVCEQFHTEMEPPHLVKVCTACGLQTFWPAFCQCLHCLLCCAQPACMLFCHCQGRFVLKESVVSVR